MDYSSPDGGGGLGGQSGAGVCAGSVRLFSGQRALGIGCGGGGVCVEREGGGMTFAPVPDNKSEPSEGLELRGGGNALLAVTGG